MNVDHGDQRPTPRVATDHVHPGRIEARTGQADELGILLLATTEKGHTKGHNMSDSMHLSRRTLVAGFAASMWCATSPARASPPPVKVTKDPNCGCCSLWVDHLRANGFTVSVHNTPHMRAVKAKLGVPSKLVSCHTAEIGSYVIEGHVPADAIKRLLAEAPAGRGLAVPGMPLGSPGMEGGTPEAYEVFLFGDGQTRVFARFVGQRPA